MTRKKYITNYLSTYIIILIILFFYSISKVYFYDNTVIKLILSLALIPAGLAPFWINYKYCKELELPILNTILTVLLHQIGFIYLLSYNKNLITTTDIIKKSIDLYKENFKLFLSYSLLLMVPSLIISIGGITSAFLFAGLNNLGVAFALFLVLAISMGLFSIWVGMSFIKVIVMRYVGTEAQSIQSNLGSTVRLILPSLWVSILTGLAVMGGMILLIIPGIIFAVWFGFGMYALVLENKRGTDALKYSKSLVSGRWFGVFWRLVAPVLVFIIIVGIAQWIVGIPFGSSLQSETATAGTFVYIILSSILSLLITPLTTIAPTILYQELKKTPLAPQAPESSEVPTA